MRAVLIDPFTRTIEEVNTTGKLAEIYSLLQVELVTVVQVNATDSLFLDDEGLFVPPTEQAYFLWSGSRQPFAGRGLILGCDEEGESDDAQISLEEVIESVTWLDSDKVNPDEFIKWTVAVF